MDAATVKQRFHGCTAVLLCLGVAIAVPGCGKRKSQPESSSIRRAQADHDSAADEASSGGVPTTEPAGNVDELFSRGYHLQAIEMLASRRSELPSPWSQAALALFHQQIELSNRSGFRHRANTGVRSLCRSATPNLGELIGLSQPNRPWVNFRQKPVVTDPRQLAQFGALSIMHALRLNGESCEAIDAIREHRLYRDRDPELLAAVAWNLSICQRPGEAGQLLVQMPMECRDYPAYWMALGNSAMDGRFEEVSARDAVDLYRMALQLEPNHLIAARAALAALDAGTEPELFDRLGKTAQGIMDIQTLVNDIASAPADSAVLVAKLAETQNGGGRPLESLAWQTWYVVAAGGEPKKMEQLRRARVEVLQKYPDGYIWDKIVGRFEPAAAGRTADRLTAAWRDRLADDAARVETSVVRPPPVDVGGSASDTTTSDCRMVEISKSAGIESRWRNAERPVRKDFRLFEPLGGGVVMSDFDRDGRIDLFFVHAGGDPLDVSSSEGDRLFHNQSDGRSIRFDEITRASGIIDTAYGHGATAGDWNQDGWEDLAVANIGENQLWINQGDGTFVPASGFGPSQQAKSAGVDSGPPVTLSLAMADVTRDHLPDLIEINYVDDPAVFDPIRYGDDGEALNLPSPLHFRSGHDSVYQQGRDGKIRKIELPGPSSTGMGVVVADFLDQGFNQIYVTNDQKPNHFWAFSSDDVFVESAKVRGIAAGPNGKALAAMGIASADFDQNGRLDLHVTNFSDEWVNLYLQSESGLFSDRAVAAGLSAPSAPMVGFGCQAIDYDNDGDHDLVVANGHIEDLRSRGEMFTMPTQVFRYDDGRFQLTSVDGADQYWQRPHLGRAVAVGDLDNDHRMDLVITDVFQAAAVFRNATKPLGGSLKIELVSTRGERSAVGAVVAVSDGKRTRRFWQKSGDGYLARNQAVIPVGLGNMSGSVNVTVQWADGQRSSDTYENIAPDSHVLIVQGEQRAWFFQTSGGQP